MSSSVVPIIMAGVEVSAASLRRTNEQREGREWKDVSVVPLILSCIGPRLGHQTYMHSVQFAWLGKLTSVALAWRKN